MNNQKLSLNDFKAKADKVETKQLLDKVQGGTDSDCHVEPTINYWYWKRP